MRTLRGLDKKAKREYTHDPKKVYLREVHQRLGEAINEYRKEIDRLIKVVTSFDKEDIAQCKEELDKKEQELFPRLIFSKEDGGKE